ncbi:DsbA family oxidoreductase [Nocardia sp. NPDC051030]|uniref:DsbA family oxidoreductase n=1 Tax=Nocardia sp. NPDC051030 TaxID=3155162 RepID=UPI00342D5D6A
MRVEIVSDISCPWCYVAKTRFRRALDAYAGAAGVVVELLPYQLNPAMSLEPQPLLDYYTERYGPEFSDDHLRVEEIGAAEGIEFDMRRALAVNTFDAHRLVWLAGRDGGPDLQWAVDDALMRAYFRDGGNVADLDTLADIAGGAGMDRARVRAALASPAGRAEVQAAIRRSADRKINAVPTFVFDTRLALRGAQSVDAFARVFEQLRAIELLVPDDPTDNCKDGNCVF